MTWPRGSWWALPAANNTPRTTLEGSGRRRGFRLQSGISGKRSSSISCECAPARGKDPRPVGGSKKKSWKLPHEPVVRPTGFRSKQCVPCVAPDISFSGTKPRDILWNSVPPSCPFGRDTLLKTQAVIDSAGFFGTINNRNKVTPRRGRTHFLPQS